MRIYKCDKCGKLIERKQDLCRMTISLYNSEIDKNYDICGECYLKYMKDFEKEDNN